MAPDLDVLIRSETDPLLFLEYHRQFTHALIFIPIGALICAAVTWPITRRWLSFKSAWLASALGYATHGVLDACTSYGTQLFWPFSDERIAWNNVSVVDPLFTVPLLALVVLAAMLRRRSYALAGLGWAVAYLAIGLFQYERAMNAGKAMAASRGHTPAMLTAKPSFANLVVWKTVYRAEGRFWIDAVRVGREARVVEGASVPVLDRTSELPWLTQGSQQARDVERFAWFSDDYVAIDPGDPLRVMDIRYSMLPQEILPLWGLELDPDAHPEAHGRFVTQRNGAREKARALLALIRDPTVGVPLPAPSSSP